MLSGGSGDVKSLGSRLLSRQSSQAVVQVLSPEHSSRRTHLQYADYAIDIFHPQDFLGVDGNIIRLRPPFHISVGVINGWFLSNVFIPYILDTEF